MYKINDVVLYGSNGVCTVVDIAEKNLMGTPKSYYFLRPFVNPMSLIYVPVSNSALVAKMHSIITKQEIYSLIDKAMQEEPQWIENESERKETFKNAISSGNSFEIFKMTRSLYMHEKQQKAKGKKLGIVDERFYKEGEKLISNEFAVALDIKPEEVHGFIAKQMHKKAV